MHTSTTPPDRSAEPRIRSGYDVRGDMAPAEPISPELVLVDPELAARVRSTGPAQDCLQPGPRRRIASSMAPGQPSARTNPRLSPPPGDRTRLRRTSVALRNVVLMLSLLANAALLSTMWSHHAGTAPTVGGRTTPASGSDGGTRSAEQALLDVLNRNATLARLFVDPVTRLVFPGVSARCNSATAPGQSRAIHCLVWLDRGGTRVERNVLYQRFPRTRLTVMG